MASGTAIESEMSFCDSGTHRDEDMPATELELPTLKKESKPEEERLIAHAPPFWSKKRGKKLSKQISMLETSRDLSWEKRRRRQNKLEEERKNGRQYITDEDLIELRGCIELGFGFEEEGGKELRKTLPALDLYFAVNRQLSVTPLPSPNTPARKSSSEASPVSSSLGERSSSFGSVMSDSDSLTILGPSGDDPELVKIRLRHWAQAVACSVMQSHT